MMSRTAETIDTELFDQYCTRFEPVFPRADQYRHFRFYLAGLLANGERKNSGAIAQQARENLPGSPDLAQALQHFVSQSPWDADRLLKGYRALLDLSPLESESALVVHDGVFPKKGRHSVGVQRQFARSFGRKINCQIAVVVGLGGPGGYRPLAMRLYLPASWLRENGERLRTEVPEPHRTGRSKAEIALDMFAELEAEGIRAERVIAEEGYAQAPVFQDGIASRGIAPADSAEGQPVLDGARRHFDWLREKLGLDHFEGRNWLGWHHHVSLVLAAYGYWQKLNRDGGDLPCEGLD